MSSILTSEPPSPTVGSDDYSYIDKPNLRFDHDTLFVGASLSCFKGARLQALSEPEPDKNLALLLSNHRETYDVDPALFSALVAGTWEGVEEHTRLQIKENNQQGFDEFTRILRRKVEATANDTPSQQTIHPIPSCQINILASPQDFPIGTAGTLVPTESTGRAPGVAFGITPDSTLKSVKMTFPYSMHFDLRDYVTGEISKCAMTVTADKWQSVVDDSLRYLSSLCPKEMNALIESPSDTNQSRAKEKLKTLGAFLSRREVKYGTVRSDLRYQSMVEQPSRCPRATSRWFFDASCKIPLNAAA